MSMMVRLANDGEAADERKRPAPHAEILTVYKVSGYAARVCRLVCKSLSSLKSYVHVETLITLVLSMHSFPAWLQLVNESLSCSANWHMVALHTDKENLRPLCLNNSNGEYADRIKDVDHVKRRKESMSARSCMLSCSAVMLLLIPAVKSAVPSDWSRP